MTREITLLVLLATGETETRPFQTEWPCIREAARENTQGREAWCIIETQEGRVKLEKYPP